MRVCPGGCPRILGYEDIFRICGQDLEYEDIYLRVYVRVRVRLSGLAKVSVPQKDILLWYIWFSVIFSSGDHLHQIVIVFGTNDPPRLRVTVRISIYSCNVILLISKLIST